jgi:hypothetical protein
MPFGVGFVEIRLLLSGHIPAQGFIAKIRECAIAGPADEIAASGRQPKQIFDKLQLSEWVTFAHPFGSPLPNHVDRLDSL